MASSLKSKVAEIIFGTDIPAGRRFDVILIICVVISVIVVLLDSVQRIADQYGFLLRAAEWLFTILFTVEYGLRIYAARKPLHYIFSFFGMVDLLAIAPTYLSLFFPGGQYLVTIRVLRVLRVFRVLKLAPYIKEFDRLITAFKASARRILVFLLAVATLAVLLGSVMYLIEDAQAGFTSIPRSIYWAIVTLTTVGYGDISPQTELGQGVAAVIMIMGYSLIVVPLGLVTAAVSRPPLGKHPVKRCPSCTRQGHDADARFCKHCGARLASSD